MTFNSEGSVALLNSARRNRNRMNEIHQEYRSEHKVHSFIERDDKSISLFLQATAPYPSEMTTEFYGWANALRASLDNLFYEIAIFDTGQNPPTAAGNRQFPIFSSEERFKTAKCLKGLHPWSVNALQTCQPFNSETGKLGHALYWLNELARTSRHRKLYEVLLAIEKLEIIIPEEVAMHTSRDEIELSDREFSFIGSGAPLRIAKINLNSPLSPSISSGFDIECEIAYEVPDWKRNVYPSYRWRLSDRMDSLEEMVDKLIQLFDNHIVKRTEFTSKISYIDGQWVRDQT